MHHCPAAQRSLRISSVGHQMIPEHTGYNIKQRQPFRIKRLIKVKTLNLPTNFFFCMLDYTEHHWVRTLNAPK